MNTNPTQSYPTTPRRWLLPLFVLALLLAQAGAWWVHRQMTGDWGTRIFWLVLLHGIPTVLLLVLLTYAWTAHSLGQNVTRARGPALAALAVLLVGMGLSLVVLASQIDQLRSASRLRFEQQASVVQEALKQRFERPMVGLNGLRAHKMARGYLDREEFRRYVMARDLAAEFPGIRGFGYIEYVLREDLEHYLDAERSDAAPDFSVRTSGEHKDLYIIKYVEPLDLNRAAWGLDIGAEAVRRAAAERAALSGRPTLSGRIKLVQDQQSRWGFLLLLPVSRRGYPTATPVERRAALEGLLYVPIVVDELLKDLPAVTGGLLDFELYDSDTVQAERLIFDSNAQHQQNPGQLIEGLQNQDLMLTVGDHMLSLRINSTPQFDRLFDIYRPAWNAAFGLALTAALTLLIWQLGLGRSRAMALVERRTADLAQSTERENAAQRENQFLLATLNLHALVSVADAKGRITFVNQAFVDTSGYTEIELLGQDHRVISSQTHPPEFWRGVWARLNQGQPWSGQICNRRKDGSLYWVKSTIVPFVDVHGMVERYVAVRTDITQQRMVQQQLRQVNEQLAAIFALSPDGYVSFDAQERVLYVSPAFEELTGLNGATVQGLDVETLWMRLLHMAQNPEQLKALSQEGRDERVLEILRPTRRTLALSLHRGQADASIRLVLHLRDITQQLVVEQMKSEFLSTAAHELRTPMVSIYGFTELLLTREMAPERVRDFLQRIYRQGGAMVRILNELLDLARIEARRGKDFVLAELDLAELVQEGIQDFQPPQDREPPLLEIKAERRRLRGDRDKLMQAIRNVLSNAYKYSPGGGAVELHIEPYSHNSRAEVRLSIRDHGLGMSPEQLSHVTERFYRADKSGNIPGTGLGMSIVKEIIELHGGSLQLESELGVGTTVHITLPLVMQPMRLASPA
ncbi:CHASE domain-containing protein [Roseateles sp. BYS180W]|uniref:histidine kinase n=1 Tax=Roseateles rivi TaxID=3299028 RepID=A0ABW7FU62_9BURK